MTASKDLNAGFRAMLQKRGQAMPNDDGPPTFPIADSEDVRKAVNLVGQVPESEKPAVRRHIIRNANKPAIGGTEHVPDSWNVDGSLKGDSSS